MNIRKSSRPALNVAKWSKPFWAAAVLSFVFFALAARTPSFAAESYDFKAAQPPANAIWLDSLDLSKVFQERYTARAGHAVGVYPMTLDGQVYTHGVGTHANSYFYVDLKKSAVSFASMVGADDEVGKQGSIIFKIFVDGKEVATSTLMHGHDKPQMLTADLKGAKRMMLMVSDAGDGFRRDHADWAGAMIFLVPGTTVRPVAVDRPLGKTMPMATGVSDNTSINGPRAVGATPGHDFIFMIPATGKKPLKFTAKNLPTGLKLNADTGIITGSLRREGTTVVELTVEGPDGVATRDLTIVGGPHRLALTPPMGWNSWNVWAGAVDAKKVRDAADSMVSSGLAAHGYEYINIDDTWEAGRDASGEIQTNEKFPDMKALADYVHSKGLKLGIYSSPGPKTCAGFTASYQHEDQDAKTYAKWGVDYLKYDWCSYGSVATGEGLEREQKPYRVMGEALDKCGRDILYSFCQYGNADVWKWGAELGGNTWRTTGDISDNWGSLSSIAFSQDGHEKYAGPGHWNDPDMLVVGKLGWGPSLHSSNLTPNEQITHITMWCLLSAPLLIGCDMTQMNQFTLDLLENDEVLAIDQDPLGQPAGRRVKDGDTEIWARPLSDGTMAVGLFNLSLNTAKVTVKWSDLGLQGRQAVRDLWQKKDLGSFSGSFSESVSSHAAVLIKVGKPKSI